MTSSTSPTSQHSNECKLAKVSQSSARWGWRADFRKDTLDDWLIIDDKNIKEVTVIYKGDNVGISVPDPDPVIRIHQIHMVLGLPDPDPDPLVRGMDPDPSITKQK